MSGSVSPRYRYGNGFFHPQTKIVRKSFISTVFVTCLWPSFKNYVNLHLPSKNNKQKRIIFCWRLEGQWRKDQHLDPLVRGTDRGSGSVQKCHGSGTLLDTVPRHTDCHRSRFLLTKNVGNLVPVSFALNIDHSCDSSPLLSSIGNWESTLLPLQTLLEIRDILVRIRIRIPGSVPLANGSGSGSSSSLQWL